jgi:hypothetical protein
MIPRNVHQSNPVNGQRALPFEKFSNMKKKNEKKGPLSQKSEEI